MHILIFISVGLNFVELDSQFGRNAGLKEQAVRNTNTPSNQQQLSLTCLLSNSTQCDQTWLLRAMGVSLVTGDTGQRWFIVLNTSANIMISTMTGHIRETREMTNGEMEGEHQVFRRDNSANSEFSSGQPELIVESQVSFMLFQWMKCVIHPFIHLSSFTQPQQLDASSSHCIYNQVDWSPCLVLSDHFRHYWQLHAWVGVELATHHCSATSLQMKSQTKLVAMILQTFVLYTGSMWQCAGSRLLAC